MSNRNRRYRDIGIISSFPLYHSPFPFLFPSPIAIVDTEPLISSVLFPLTFPLPLPISFPCPIAIGTRYLPPPQPHLSPYIYIFFFGSLFLSNFFSSDHINFMEVHCIFKGQFNIIIRTYIIKTKKDYSDIKSCHKKYILPYNRYSLYLKNIFLCWFFIVIVEKKRKSGILSKKKNTKHKKKKLLSSHTARIDKDESSIRCITHGTVSKWSLGRSHYRDKDCQLLLVLTCSFWTLEQSLD